MSGSPELGRAARAYALRLAFHVLPLARRRKEPLGRLAPHGYLDATRDPHVIARWWRSDPHANVGIACAPSGVVVIDVDPRNGGDETFAAFERELGALSRTWTVLTPSGGAHYYLGSPEHPVGAVLGPGVDIKHHGYVVAPPSVHPNGGAYRWDLGVHPLETPIASVPANWLARMRARREGPVRASARADACESFLGAAFAAVGWLGRPLGDGRRAVRCPWLGEHSDGRGDGHDSSTVIFPCAEGGSLGAFLCSHAHCFGRRSADVVRVLPPDAIDAAARAFPNAYRNVVWRLAAASGRLP